MKGRPLQEASRNRGFSLMELAIVLMIIGTLMSGVLVAVSQTAENNRITAAKAQLREIEEALYGYAQAYGRLPCPATDLSSSPNVAEDMPCTNMHGFVPSGTLGIDGQTNADGLLVDPWQQPLRYSVVILNVANSLNFTDQSSIQTYFDGGAVLDNSSGTDMFSVCEDTTCTDTISDLVPAVVLSVGKNWSTYSSANEAMNAGALTMNGYEIKDDYIFISTSYSEENFDDQLIWLSPYVLFNRLVTAGKLP